MKVEAFSGEIRSETVFRDSLRFSVNPERVLFRGTRS
jgi:hypothetical protein